MTTEKILELYEKYGSIKKTAEHCHVAAGTVRKHLISAGAFTSPRLEEISALAAEGLTPREIAEKLHVSKSTINNYLPFFKGPYRAENPTVNALRIRASRNKRKDKINDE